MSFLSHSFPYIFLKSGVTALKPKISVVDKAVVARKGSTVTLMCSATRVRKLTTSSSWKFNGPEIKKRNNKIIIPEPHYQTNKRRGNYISVTIRVSHLRPTLERRSSKKLLFIWIYLKLVSNP